MRAGVVHQQPDRPELGLDLRDRGANCRAVEHVGLHGQRAGVDGGLLQLGGRAGDDRDVGASRPQLPDDRQPDAAGAAGDDRDTAAEVRQPEPPSAAGSG
jgi:hypothetical protein